MSGFDLGTIRIDNNNDYCFIIAEAGSNHDQNKAYAYELVEVAAAAGADAIKFQLFSTGALYSKFVGKKIFQATRHAELPPNWIPEIMDRCKSQKVTFLATPFDYNSVDYLDHLGVPAFKWASGEIVDLELLGHAAKKGKPMIVSTGMCSLSDIETAIDVINTQHNKKIALLHCISLYPTNAEDANLRMMDTLANAFEYPVGFSDHTLGIAISITAVARGARILEKHFTLDRKLKSPDHPFSLRPKELKEMVDAIRKVCDSLGDGRKVLLNKERSVAKVARRSVIANQRISKGTKLSKSMLTVKRPGTGIPPSLLPLVVNRKTKINIKEDQILTWDVLE